MKTRLDVVVRLREHTEKGALQGLVRATEDAAAADARVQAARQRAQHDGRGSGAAAEWAMVEVARERALFEVKTAQAVASRAATAVESARSTYQDQHRQTEVVRRVADARRLEAVTEQRRHESRTLDELGSLLAWRKSG